MEVAVEDAILQCQHYAARKRCKQFSTFRFACLALQEALEEENKARIEQAKKMDLLIKRMDHTERARRENEAPLLQEAYAQKVKVAFFCLVGLMLHATQLESCRQPMILCSQCSSQLS